MSLIIDKNLLSVNKLIEHGIQIEDASHSYHSDVIRILIVNLMPKKCETEFQFKYIWQYEYKYKGRFLVYENPHTTKYR